MPLPHLSSNPNFGALVTLTIPIKTGAVRTGALRYRYQNFRADPPAYVFPEDGLTYNYLNFAAGLPPRRLELDSSQGTVQLPNNSIVRELYNQHNGLAESILFVRFVFPGMAGGEDNPLTRKAQIISSSVGGSEITLEIGTPVGFLEGRVITKVYDKQKFPVVAHTLNVNVG